MSQADRNEAAAMFVSPNTSSHFGEHVMIDGYKCSQTKLDDCNLVLACLQELPEHLGMKALSAPEIYFAKGGGPKDPGGWTAFVVIEESHISIHTFPIFKFVSIDIYTCKNGLNIFKIEKYFRDKLSIEIFETNFVKRGRQFAEFALPQCTEIDCNEVGFDHVR